MPLTEKIALPKLDWAYNALEPHISGQINEIHHSKHHQTYVNSFNAAIDQLEAAEKKNDLQSIVEIQQNIKFHGGGHLNHTNFWKSLAPVSAGGGKVPGTESPLGKQIACQYGSTSELIDLINVKLAAIQGAGWAFLVKNREAGGALDIVTTSNQDVPPAKYTVLLAIDAWEHAYYLQYQNVKMDYFKAIWNVMNWKGAEHRFSE